VNYEQKLHVLPVYLAVGNTSDRFESLRGLRRGSAAVGLLGFWIRIRPVEMVVCLFLSVMCCQVEVSASG
jgi:hypothetical protein